MKKVMMIYNIPEGSDIKRITFNRKLFSYNLQSHGGRYKRKSAGILHNFEKPVRSCVIFDYDYLKEVRKLCKNFKVQSVFYQIKEV